jgi:citrate lyase beta subunit
VQHFAGLGDERRAEIFAEPPQPFDAHTDRRRLATGLGATLYTPGTRHDYADRLAGLVRAGVTSAVLCLEDSIADHELGDAQANVVAQLRRIHEHTEAPPALFVRVRAPDQICQIVEALGPARRVLTGFVLPKLTAEAGGKALQAVADVDLLAMPVLETEEVMYAETRLPELLALRSLLAEYDEHVLAVRIGATDLCGLFGLRRSPDTTIYDLAVIGEAIAAIVNVLGRHDGWVVTGPVWEYFTETERLLKPLLRTTPFSGRGEIRRELLASDLDGLLREVMLDRATGLVGKTTIHPSHVAPIHALQAVTHDEWADAQSVVASAGGASKGCAHDGTVGMVEAKPHARWAAAVIRRASVFGVLRPERSFVDLLEAAA